MDDETKRPPQEYDERATVECYSGYKAGERPLAFAYRGCRLEISEILDRWYEGTSDSARPKTDYFKVRTKDGKVYLLRYLSLFDAWTARRLK
ncbi:MAG: hypothetical protein PHG54_06715 [Smithellaceae bacterium]|nr:hypothetical protein [Syntrophaceae bacterium]MDD4241107.1 hypothetical protein [Smithellaceae bacterium]NLX52197.1 cytoplasmic protein [Deltaproteobacteria bacterium]